MDSNKTIGFDRRDFLKGATGAALLLTSRNGFGFAKCYDDDALLDELAHRCYQYFWDARFVTTRLVLKSYFRFVLAKHCPACGPWVA
jgi:hypothetical protein